jgi:hypothetical protein
MDAGAAGEMSALPTCRSLDSKKSWNRFLIQRGHSAKIKNGIFFKNDLQSGHRTVDP